jgi:hypothetical protein
MIQRRFNRAAREEYNEARRKKKDAQSEKKEYCKKTP